MTNVTRRPPIPHHPQRHGARRLPWAASAALAALLTACGGDAEPDAAEPERAPALTVVPAGTVRPVAPSPEGIVYEPRSGSVAVAVREPDRLLVLDPRSLDQLLRVPLPGKARHLQVTVDGRVLVPSEQGDALVEVRPGEGEVRRTSTGRYPHDASEAASGDLVVSEEFGASMSVLREGDVVHRFDDLAQPGGVVAVGDVAVVVDVEEFTLSSYDLVDLQRIDRVDAGAGPTHVALVADDVLAVTDTRGDAVHLYSVDPLERIAEIEVAGRPYGLATDPETETVWVTLTERNQLVGLDATGDELREIARYPTVRQPNTVAVAPGARALWVTGTADGEVQRIDR